MKKILAIMILILSCVTANADSGWPCSVDYKNGHICSLKQIGKYAESERNEVDRMKSKLIGLDPWSEEYHNIKMEIIKQEEKASKYEEEYRYRKTKEEWTVQIEGNDKYILVEVPQNTSIEEFMSMETNAMNILRYTSDWDWNTNYDKEKYPSYRYEEDYKYRQTFKIDNYTLYRTENPAFKVKITSPREEMEITVYKRSVIENSTNNKQKSKLQQNPEKAKKLDGSWN